MSDERGQPFGEEDFGEGGEVIEEEGSNSMENGGEMMSFLSLNKRSKQVSIDRLSSLPDALLIHILSHLGMKNAGITSVLSKRWQYLWTELPNLNFWENSTHIGKTRKLVSLIHRTLVLRTGNYLDQLKISFAYDECFDSDVNAWVEFAVRNKVKQLNLWLHSRKDIFYMLPQVTYSCSSLTSMSLLGCILAPQRTIDWKSLTQLSIQGVELQEHVIRKISSGCPVLSSLYLTSCWGFECLDIDTPSLLHLTIEDCEDGYTELLLEISAPYIHYLSISPLIERKKVRLPNIPSLVCADIHFDMSGFGGVSEEELIDMIDFFEDIKHVKELTLGCQFLAALSKLADNGLQLPQSMRECLKVEAWRDEHSSSGIVALLESSPNLETLAIHCDDPFEVYDTWGPVARNDLACDLLHLKTVTLTGYANPNFSGEPILTMAKILLKRATALEKMVVNAYGSLTESSTFFIEIAQQLLSYPRSSRKAAVFLHH